MAPQGPSIWEATSAIATVVSTVLAVAQFFQNRRNRRASKPKENKVSTKPLSRKIQFWITVSSLVSAVLLTMAQGLYLGAASGVLLVGLGGVVALRAQRSDWALPLFLMIWGTQIVFTNMAWDNVSYALSVTLYWTSRFLGVLQGTLLLCYAAESTVTDANQHQINTYSRKMAMIMGLVFFMALLLLVLSPSLLFSAHRELDGSYQILENPLSVYLLEWPAFLSVALALVLLTKGSQANSWAGWTIPVGLSVGWANSLSSPLAAQFVLSPSPPMAVILGFTTLCVAVYIPAIIFSDRSSGQRLRLGAVAVSASGAVAVLTHFGPATTSYLYPETFRILSLAWLVPALRSRNWEGTNPHGPTPSKAVSMAAGALTIIAGATIFSVAPQLGLQHAGRVFAWFFALTVGAFVAALGIAHISKSVFRQEDPGSRQVG